MQIIISSESEARLTAEVIQHGQPGHNEFKLWIQSDQLRIEHYPHTGQTAICIPLLGALHLASEQQP